MNARIRTGILVAIIGLALIVIGVYVVVQFFIPNQQVGQIAPVAEFDTMKVVIVTRDLALGDLIDATDVTYINAPVEIVPRSAITNIEDAIGRITKNAMIEGEILLNQNLADPTNTNYDLAFILSDDHVLMAFPASDLMSQISIIQRGDIIDILATVNEEVKIVTSDTNGILEEEETTQTITFPAMQRVSVTALVVEIIDEQKNNNAPQGSQTFVGGELQEDESAPPAVQPTVSPNDIKIRAYLLALSPQDALVLKNLIDLGAIFDLVLRSPTSTQDFVLTPVTEEYIIELYGLDILP